MSFEERNTWLGLVVGLGILWWFGSAVWENWQAGIYDGPDGLTIWARDVIWVIPVGVVVMIVAVILMHILYGIVTGGKIDGLTDERDRWIGLWGLRVTLGITSVVFIAALAGLAWGWTPLLTFNLMLFGFWAGSFIGDLVKVFIYRMDA